MNIPELFQEGGLAMWPLLVLSILALTTIIERIWFWSKILTREREIAGRVIEAARRDWQAAADIARRANDQPIGRFLYNALHLYQPVPEVFQLALETAADEELTAMRRGDKILEVVIALSPLLGLLGTVLGLMESLGSISLGDIGTTSTAGVTFGISRALITTATGLIIAIASLAFYRLFQGFVFGQSKIFRKAGNELELLYRKDWSEHRFITSPAHPSAHPSHLAAAAVANVQEAQPANGDGLAKDPVTDPAKDLATDPATDPSPSDPSSDEPASEESSTY